MDVWILVAFVFVLLAQTVALLVLFFRHKKGEDSSGMLLLQRELQSLSATIDKRLGDSSREVHSSMQTQLAESAKLVREVTAGLTKLDETNRRVVSFTEELRGLQDVLSNPKQRGVLGEYYLETVLKNVLPPGQFALQYKFADGEIVDAVVYLEEGKVLPIDSKFSLENYNRMREATEQVERERLEKLFRQDLKTRIDETAKYVRPGEDTMDFAFMFIPSEGVYYDILSAPVGVSARDLIEYAYKKKVIIVSPTSFLAYLQTVLQGMRAHQIQEEAGQIIKRVGELGRHLKVYEESYNKLGASMRTTVNHYNSGAKELGKIDKDVLRITGSAAGLTSDLIEKPEERE